MPKEAALLPGLCEKAGTWLGMPKAAQSATIFRTGCKDGCDLGCDWLPV